MATCSACARARFREPPSPPIRAHHSPVARRWLIVLALGAIVVASAVLRFWDLAHNPGGLYTDEAVEALSAHRILTQPVFHPVFFTYGGGREALFAYLVAGVFRFAGETTLALRATAAGIGVAGVLGIWLLGRRFSEGTGLVAAAWAAGSLWLICISRDGMRNILVPVVGALALVALLAWADRPTRIRASIAGAVTALAALYTYQPLKLLPLLVVLWLVWLRHADRERYLRLRTDIGWFVLAFAVVAAPIAFVAITDPAAYFGRALGVTPLSSETAGVNLLDHWLRTLGMFAATGDPNPRHDVAALPLLGWPVSIVAAVGVVRLWRDRRRPGASLILLSLPVFLLPPMVATEGGAPHFLRSLGLAAPLAVTVGVGTVELLRLISDRWGASARNIASAVAAVGLIGLGVANGITYLNRQVADRYDAFRFDLVAMADAARPTDAVILDDYDATVIRFLDASATPAVVAPGSAISQPTPFERVLAVDSADLIRSLGTEITPRMTVFARRPDGSPAVYAASP
jgi:4-amino-4-deoxy-L-arabinose transferase-like glycosyltransferase